MKKLNLWLLASLFVAAFTLAACGDDNDSVTPPPAPEGDVSSIEGTWKSAFTGVTCVFSGDKFSIKESDGTLLNDGTYTLKDNVITFNYTDDGKAVKATAKVTTLYQKQALVIKGNPDDGEGYSIFEAAEVFFKDGKAPTTSVNDIQGNWYWYTGKTKNVRAAMFISGNKFEVIVGAWGVKYVGTYTYEGGTMKLNITNGYTSREPHTGYGLGYGNMDPETLDATWYVLDQEHWIFENEIVFISAGSEAYGALANLPAVYYKENRTPKVNPIESLAGTKWYETENSSPADKLYMTWVFDGGQADWGNLMWSTENGRWEKFTRHSFILTVDGCDITLTTGDGNKRSGYYVIEDDEMTLFFDGLETKLTRIKDDLLTTWNNAIKVEI